jgi:flagellar L-ring protein precursor FlgH
MQRVLAVILIGLLAASAACADSLFNAAAAESGTLISDKKVKFKVGDLITVLVQETIDASTEADTDTKKESAVEAQAPASQNQFLTAEGPGGLNILSAKELPNWSIDIENEHKAKGKTRRANKLIMTVACVVTEVFDNGNITIEGDKRITVNREESKLHVKGMVRSRDVTPANVVLSSQIANAEIELIGKGPLWNNQRRGLFTRILDWFSPF